MLAGRTALVCLVALTMATGGLLRPCECPASPGQVCETTCAPQAAKAHQCGGHAHRSRTTVETRTPCSFVTQREACCESESMRLCPAGPLPVLESPENRLVDDARAVMSLIDRCSILNRPVRQSQVLSDGLAPPGLGWRLLPAALGAFLI